MDQHERQTEQELRDEERWHELRDRLGRLYARYDPFSETLEIRQRGVTVRFALERYRIPLDSGRVSLRG